ncbi:MAG: hypothetical protein ACR2M1_05690 [Gemmatimonadaceae bacterium]
MTNGNTGIAVEPLSHLTRSGRAYRRTVEVDAQIASALRLSSNELTARAKVRDRDAPDFLKEECLVYFIRVHHRAADLDTVNALSQVLLERCALWITRRFRALGLDKEDALTAYQQLVSEMIDAIIDPGSDRGEFFQVRFWRALRCRLLNAYDAWLRANKRDAQYDSLTGSISGPNDADDDAGNHERLEERLGSGEDLALDLEHRTMIQEALLAIRDEQHREAFVLRHFEGWPLEAADPHGACLSRRFRVSVKTVYNWLQTAEADLAAWRDTRDAR